MGDPGNRDHDADGPAPGNPSRLPWLESFIAPRPSLDDRFAEGRALRRQVPRSAHAEFTPRKTGASALEILQAQNAERIASLAPVRMARMAASPFAFLRGAAAVMAADLARTPATDLRVMACGDMHLLNFGLFASAERNLIFAINDFDEAHPGPWEWDLKRLAASAAAAATFLGGDRALGEAAAWAAADSYARQIAHYAQLGYLETWYDRIDADSILAAVSPERRKAAQEIIDKARAKGSIRALDKLTEQVDGEHRIVEDTPLIVRETHLKTGMPVAEAVDRMLASYVASLPEDRRRLLSRYRLVDVARKVVGVGSVGTSCWVVLFEGVSSGDPLLLQVKQALPSVLAPYVRTDVVFRNQGQRVVTGQRMIQGSPDIFLGWGPEDETAGLADYYVRQLADMKGGLKLQAGDKAALDMLQGYCRLGGWALALAHAKSGDAARISGYIGRGGALADAVSRFALGYAEQTERDHEALTDAIRKGRIQAATPQEAGLAQ